MLDIQTQIDIQNLYRDFLRRLETTLIASAPETEKPRDIYVLINQVREKRKLISLQNGIAIAEDSNGWIVAYDLREYAIRFIDAGEDHE